jgi:anaerobic magnesium-protoporphyrin IX monomethyl ester cyclase
VRVLVATVDSVFPPAGAADVAAALRQSGHDVSGHLYRDRASYARELDRIDPDVVMLGGLCVHLNELSVMGQEAKRRGPLLVVGGGLASSEPELATEGTGADVAVVGQGERTAVELLHAVQNRKPASEVNGLVVKGMRFGVNERTPPRQDETDLDALPFPAYDVFGYDRWLDGLRPSDKGLLSIMDRPREYALVASRSCPFHCTFCWHTSGGRYRQRSVRSVESELSQVVPRYRINIVTVVDELFAVTDERVEEFCCMMERVQERAGWPVRWSCSLRVSDATPHRLDALKASGCYSVGYGLESYSARVLTSMKKRTNPAQIRTALSLAHERGLANNAGNFIFGDPAETLETAEETLRFWRANRHLLIQLGYIVPCPDSEGSRLCLERGLIRDKRRHFMERMFEPLNMTDMSDDDHALMMSRLIRANSLDALWADGHAVGDSVTAECPHCGKPQRYRNFALGWGKPVVVCRDCMGGFMVSRAARRTAQRLAARLVPDSGWPFLAVKHARRAVKALRRMVHA